MPQVIALETKKLATYEVGAVLLMLLTFPEAPVEVQTAVHDALCARSIRERARVDRNWRERPHRIKPRYFLSDVEIRSALKTFDRRLRDRMTAARMAIGLLKPFVTDEPLPKGLKRRTVNQLAEFVMTDSRQREPRNVVSRVWKPSLPVIHLAVSLQLLLHRLDGAGRRLHPIELLIDLSLIKGVISGAGEIEVLLARHKKFQRSANARIQLRAI